MSMETLQQLISNLGFPIVVCLILLIQYKKTIEVLSKSVQEGMEKLSFSINKLAESLRQYGDDINNDIRLVIREEISKLKKENDCGEHEKIA